MSLTTQVYRHAIDAAWEALHSTMPDAAAAGAASDTAASTGEGAAQGSTAGVTLTRAEAAAATERAKAAVKLGDAQRRELEQVGGASNAYS